MQNSQGVKPVGWDERNLTGMDFLLLWAGAAVSLAEIWAGGLLVPLGFMGGILAVFLGHLIGNTPLALGGIIGSRTGLPTMVSVRPSFGVRGSYFPTVLNLVQLVGWTGVMIWIGGQAAQAVWPFPEAGFHGWAIVTGIVTTLWAVLGHRFWKWLQRIAVTGLLLLCGVMTYMVFSHYGWEQLARMPSKDSMPFMVGLDLVIAMPISWLPLVCDYSRFSKSTSAAFWGTWIGYFLVSSWMYIVGLGAALATQSATPDSLVMQLMVKVGLALPAIIIVLFSTFTTTFLDIYSTAVSSLNIWPELGERRGSILCGVLGTGAGPGVSCYGLRGLSCFSSVPFSALCSAWCWRTTFFFAGRATRSDRSIDRIFTGIRRASTHGPLYHGEPDSGSITLCRRRPPSVPRFRALWPPA